MQLMFTDALKTAIEPLGFKLVDLAREFGVDKAAVTRWNQLRVPAGRVERICEITGAKAYDLRPDVFPAPENKAPSNKEGAE